MESIIELLRHAAGAIAELWRTTEELHQRRAILNRPWLHDRMHWSMVDDDVPCLHGHELPEQPGDVPVTTQGWCACPVNTQPRSSRGTGASTESPR